MTDEPASGSRADLVSEDSQLEGRAEEPGLLQSGLGVLRFYRLEPRGFAGRRVELHVSPD